MTDKELYLIGLRAIGKGGLVTQLGKITAWFTTDEIAEIIEEDQQMEKNLKQWEEETKILKEERENFFFSGGVITPEQAQESRNNYLLDEHNKSYKELKRARRDHLHPRKIEKLDGKYNKTRFHYNIFAYKPEYNDGTVSNAELEEARKKHVGQFIELDRKGFAKCPFHNERTASFHADKNLWYCFGCGEAGDTIKFVMKQRNIGFKEAVKVINSL